MEAAPGLRKALVADEDPAVRAAVAKALASMPPARARPLLTRLVSDSDDAVVTTAIGVVGEMGCVEAIPSLVNHARNSRLALAVAAGRALRHLGNTDGAVLALDRVGAGMKSPDPLERSMALSGIVAIGGEVSIPYLEQARQDESGYLRHVADKALRKLEEEK